MSSVGVVLDKIRERRIREGYREPQPPREWMHPDLAERCARYPTAALLCFLAAAGGLLVMMVLVVSLFVVANSKAPAPAAPKAVPAGARRTADYRAQLERNRVRPAATPNAAPAGSVDRSRVTP